MFYLNVLNIFLIFRVVNCGVLVLSPKKIEILSLKAFDEQTFDSLKNSVKNVKIITFKLSDSETIPDNCENLLINKFSAYVPNVEYYPENAIVLKGNSDVNCKHIQQKIESNNQDKNTIYLLIHEPRKIKRSIVEDEGIISSSTTSSTSTATSTSTTEESIKTTTERTYYREKASVDPDEPVVYDSNGKALLYSSKAPVLRIQNDTEFILGSATLVTVDDRDSYSRLIATIPVEDGKVTLRFRFPWDSGYWWLTSVEVVDMEGKVYNLTINSEVSAPRNFSHNCGGETIFTDGTASLTLHNLQVQPITTEGRFSDSYNCVPFTTVPIWSGLFITSILAVGLGLGLTALGSIKTMDKFDNSKTKQLSITLIGE